MNYHPRDPQSLPSPEELTLLVGAIRDRVTGERGNAIPGCLSSPLVVYPWIGHPAGRLY